MMNNSKNDDDSLPDGWVLCQSKSVPGRIYYFQRKTGKSLWTKPEAEDKLKKGKREKNRTDETDRKSLKRKSDSCVPESSPKKRNHGESQPPTPDAKHKDSPPPGSVKNSANKRLQQLRKQISEELSSKDHRHDDQTEKGHSKSPVKHKRDTPKPSPKSHTEVQNKNGKTLGTDLKSPTFNESRCSTNQSPSSDSLQSSPSPSQFFTANKILSSMKAQLPEQYCNQMKAKDTFADINHAICTQTPEYPSMKHPATPPQFSEASKIVSAIKSKLSYNPLVCKDSDVAKFSSAKDRMDVLRKRLSYEVEDKGGTSGYSNSEAMEVEDYKEIKQNQSPQKMQCSSTTKSDDDNLVLVVDTNIFIHELDVIKNVLNSHIKGYTEQPTLLVPWRVINELDRLKDNNNGNGAICKRAKAAMDYLYQSLPKNNRIKGQSLRDANSHIYPCELPDDEILNCSLQQAERGKSVILLSNDKNLCNKAIINGVKSIGLSELKTQLESKVCEGSDPDLQASLRHYETSIYQLLANILENEMRDKYKSLWQHVVFKEPPWSLRDVLQCLLKHWLAVFSELFPRIEHLITDLSNALHSLHDKNPKTLTNSEVENFKELSLEVARKCQIIPEYMELAKQTVEGITRGGGAAAGAGAGAGTGEGAGAGAGAGEGAGEGAGAGEAGGDVIASFEHVWTVMSAYCAKLASGLGVSHSVEDKVAGRDTLPALTGKWSLFSTQIFDITNSIKGVLDASNEESMADSLSRLEVVLRESLSIINVDPGVISRDNLTHFCAKNRNMLQEAFTKFAELTELLDVCRNVMTK